MLVLCAAFSATVNNLKFLYNAQGSSIQQLVINSAFFHRAQSVGLYVTCERLREVDTMAVLQAALQQGVHSDTEVKLHTRQQSAAPVGLQHS